VRHHLTRPGATIVLVGVLASFSIGNIWVAFVLVPLMATVRIIFTYVLAKTRQSDPDTEEAPAGGGEPAPRLAASDGAGLAA